MTTTEQRSQLATTGRIATWVFVIGLVLAGIGLFVMNTDLVVTGGVIAVVGLIAVIVCGALRAFAKR